MKKLCIVTTLWSSVNNWIVPFIDEYHNHNIDITIVCNMDDQYEKDLKERFPFIHTYAIGFPRGMDVIGTIKGIFELILFFSKEKFDMVQYSTPNASFYSAIASFVTRIPVRLYCQWGMVYVTKKGLVRWICELIERLTCKCSTQIQPDSYGNLKFCRDHKFYNEENSNVIWNGSAKGINLEEYNVYRKEEYKKEIKEKYNLSTEPIIGFVGRLGGEKGCNELFKAFKVLKSIYPNLVLLFVGPIEKEDTIESELLKYFKENNSIIKTGRVKDVPRYMAAMDVFVLPSYREGFGMSVVEASAMEVPVVATKYPGPSGGMKDGVTGFEVSIGNVDELVEKISYLLNNPLVAKQMGSAGRKFAEEKFDYRIFKKMYIENRLELIKKSEKQRCGGKDE